MSRVQTVVAGVAAVAGISATVLASGVFWMLLTRPEAFAQGSAGIDGVVWMRWVGGLMRLLAEWL